LPESDDALPVSTGPEAGESDNERGVSRQFVQAAYVGPLPPAAEFERYEDALPGAADRILAMAEREQQARLNRETTHQQLVVEDQKLVRQQVKRGQVFGLAVSLAAILCGTITAIVGSVNGHTAGTVVGAVIGTGGLASIIIAFTATRLGDSGD